MKFQNPSLNFFLNGQTDVLTRRYLCGYVFVFWILMWLFAYVWLRIDTQESILATKVSNLRNKSHLYSKMTTCVSNCPNFIATGVPIG